MDSNVADLVTRAASQEPDKILLSEAATGRTVTGRGLEDLVQRVAQGLSDAGMVAGYRVMVATGNRIELDANDPGAWTDPALQSQKGDGRGGSRY